MKEINKKLVEEMIKIIKKDEKKSKSLNNAIDRNGMFTSDWCLPYVTLRVYKQGFYLIAEGCRCKFSAYFEDNDGELILKNRKPNESKLELIYEDGVNIEIR